MARAAYILRVVPSEVASARGRARDEQHAQVSEHRVPACVPRIRAHLRVNVLLGDERDLLLEELESGVNTRRLVRGDGRARSQGNEERDEKAEEKSHVELMSELMSCHHLHIP